MERVSCALAGEWDESLKNIWGVLGEEMCPNVLRLCMRGLPGGGKVGDGEGAPHLLSCRQEIEQLG